MSGVRSWCEAFATNSRWAFSVRPSRSVMSLNAVATSRCSLEPSGRARASRSPPATRRAVPARAAQRARERPREQPGHAEPEQQRRPRPRRSAPARRCAPLVCTASTLWVTRTAPTVRPPRTTGTAVKSTSSPSVSLWRVPWSARPRSALATSRAARVGDSPQAGPGGVGEQPAARAHDDHPAAEVAPRRAASTGAELAPIAEPARDGGRERPAACPCASLLISASTRRERLSASGTSSATITSTST